MSGVKGSRQTTNIYILEEILQSILAIMGCNPFDGLQAAAPATDAEPERAKLLRGVTSKHTKTENAHIHFMSGWLAPIFMPHALAFAARGSEDQDGDGPTPARPHIRSCAW